MADSILSEEYSCLLKIQQYGINQLSKLNEDQKKLLCDRINRNALNNFLDPIVGEMRSTNEIEILKNKILNGFPESSRLEIAMGVIAIALPMPTRAPKTIEILANEVEINALIKIGEGSCAKVYKCGKDHVLKTLNWGEEDARMMAESINYLAKHIPSITPVTHTGGNRLLQRHIEGVVYDELPVALKEEAKKLLLEDIYTAYSKVHGLQTRGIRAEIDSETHNFVIQHNAEKITNIHWIDPVSNVMQYSLLLNNQ